MFLFLAMGLGCCTELLRTLGRWVCGRGAAWKHHLRMCAARKTSATAAGRCRPGNEFGLCLSMCDLFKKKQNPTTLGLSLLRIYVISRVNNLQRLRLFGYLTLNVFVRSNCKVRDKRCGVISLLIKANIINSAQSPPPSQSPIQKIQGP